MSRSLLDLLGSQARVAAVAAAALALGAGGALAATAPSGLQRLAAQSTVEPTDLDQTDPAGPALGDAVEGDEQQDAVLTDGDGDGEDQAADEQLVDGDDQPADQDADQQDGNQQDAEDADGEEQDGGGPAEQIAPPCPDGVTNHGQYVSGVARGTAPGPDHGKAVSAAARLGCTPADTAGDQDADGTAVPGSTGSPEDADDAQEPASRGRSADAPGRAKAEQGAANGKGHGNGNSAGKGSSKGKGNGRP